MVKLMSCAVMVGLVVLGGCSAASSSGETDEVTASAPATVQSNDGSDPVPADQTVSTQAGVRVGGTSGATTGKVSPRPCLKCEGCSTSRGWNACCAVVEVACSAL